MKYKIDAAAHSALTPELQALYAQSGDDYTLTVDGLPDTHAENEALRKHNEKLIGEKRERDELARQAQAEKVRIEQEAAKKSGDWEALEKSIRAEAEQKAAQAEEYKTKYTELQRTRDSDLIEREAMRAVRQIADDPASQDLLTEFAKKHLSVVDGQAVILDEHGNATTTPVSELANVMKNSGRYDPLITGTRGSGTGGQGQGIKGVKAASEYTEAERIELATKNPELFKQLFKS